MPSEPDQSEADQIVFVAEIEAAAEGAGQGLSECLRGTALCAARTVVTRC